MSDHQGYELLSSGHEQSWILEAGAQKETPTVHDSADTGKRASLAVRPKVNKPTKSSKNSRHHHRRHPHPNHNCCNPHDDMRLLLLLDGSLEINTSLELEARALRSFLWRSCILLCGSIYQFATSAIFCSQEAAVNCGLPTHIETSLHMLGFRV